MRVLVIGGAGYVGSHVVRTLVDFGHEPVVFDNLSTGHAAAIGDVDLVKGDVRDRASLEHVLRRQRFDGAIHLAACSLVGESMREPARYFDNNIIGGIALFDALVASEVPWVVLSSTAAVYGDPEFVPITEDHPQAPTNPYGESKRVLERILAWYARAYGLRSAALRYFNAAGAHPDGHIGEDHTPETHLIPIVLQVALGLRPTLEVYGADYETPDRTAVRDYVHVCDLARAHVDVISRLTSQTGAQAFNLGSERGYSVLEVIEAARRVTGREIPFELKARRPGDPPILVANAESAFNTFDWKPHFPLEQMIATAWRWHSEHPNGYRR